MSDTFPQPVGRPVLAPAAYHGLLGEIVRHAAPMSEGDIAGIMGSLLSFTSAMLGRSVAIRIKTKEHPLNVSTLLIGSSGNGKKGSATDVLDPYLWAADPEFMGDCVRGAVASGEGLIAEVRDPDPDDVGFKIALEGGEVTDVGASCAADDFVGGRRAIFYDEEFATNTMVALSFGTTAATLRKCWDGVDLFNHTKKESMRASRPHVVFHGHATPQAFVRKVSGHHAEGGTYNRFLIFFVHRSKVDSDIAVPKAWSRKAQVLGLQLGINLKLAREGHEEGLTRFIELSKEAKALWKASLYRKLSTVDEDQLEVVQQFTTRQGPYALRVAALYAVMDGRMEISLADLQAATAIVEYSMSSVLYLSTEFVAASAGEKPQDRQYRLDLKTALQKAGDGGLTRTHISHEVLNSKYGPGGIDDLLTRVGAVSEMMKPPRGRRIEVWYLPEFAPDKADES